jgi:DDE superfamily endonuclease
MTETPVGTQPSPPGPVGGRVLAHQPDHASDRPTVRRLALRRPPGHRHPRTPARPRAGTPPPERPDRDRRRHLIPTRDHRLAAQSKNYRYSANLQVAIDANTRLVIALGDPQPGNRNDTIVYRSSGIARKLAGREVMADGGYRGNPQVIMPYRKPRDGSELAAWKQDYNTGHRKIRARVEHALARLKTYKILRDYRRAGHTLAVTASSIAHLHNIALAG